MGCHIMVIKVGARRSDAPKLQEVLSQFGCSIKTRLGLHETQDVCSEEGIVILQLSGDTTEMLGLEQALNKLESVKAQMVVLN